MHFLIFCILSSTGIFVVFKSINHFGLSAFPIVVINYLAATILGLIINPGKLKFSQIREMEWLPISIMIGIMFIIMFFLIAFSSRKAVISVTTVASKMSVIFPIIFSLIIESSDKRNLVKTVTIVCTLCGVALILFTL